VAHVDELGLRHLYSGKVRDLYEVDHELMLMVASDRLSAFDVVMNEPIPEKGRVLTGLTDYWVKEFARDTPSALVTCDPREIDKTVVGFFDRPDLHGRTMLVRRAEMVNLECVVRGRLAGQAYDEYIAEGTVHHMPAPLGMRLTDPFPEPIFTPSTKAESGHDLNIDMASAAENSSRIWPANDVRSGETPPSFDKQPLRDWLKTLDWNRMPPPPPVPEEIVRETSTRYAAAYERVTGRSLLEWYGFSQ
jgi:phosphoribosylaminoimidazole-succinocarboxamide synthase